MSASTTETKAERARRFEAWIIAEDARKMAELSDHPNAAITTWHMLPGCNYGAVLDGRKIIGYTVGLAGEPKKFMPIVVARRLVKSGQCKYSDLGDLWIQSLADWQPKARKAKRS